MHQPKLQEAKDSRLFGPVNMTDIVGRVIYRLRTCVDHGCVRNRWTKFLSYFLCKMVWWKGFFNYWYNLLLCHSFQHAENLASVGSGTWCWGDVQESQGSAACLVCIPPVHPNGKTCFPCTFLLSESQHILMSNACVCHV